jgi:protein phosphatase
MGTTLIVTVLASNGVLYWAHLGDSRIYTTKEGCITEDHAVGAHELTNFAGRSLTASPDLGSTTCEQGKRILLTTDGLNKVVSDEEIMEVMTKSNDGEEILNTLLELALDYGGPDNVTMILLDHA